MPQRTNEYQRIVALIQRSLAPEGAKVTESAMVDVNGFDREIDVLVEGQFGMYRFCVAVEAKDHSRPVDVTTVEQLCAKYAPGSGIAVNQTVLVARNGFTP